MLKPVLSTLVEQSSCGNVVIRNLVNDAAVHVVGSCIMPTSMDSLCAVLSGVTDGYGLLPPPLSHNSTLKFALELCSSLIVNRGSHTFTFVWQSQRVETYGYLVADVCANLCSAGQFKL